MRQTWALLVDAYRELNARKLFWITLGLSGLIVAAFAAAGINDRGLTFLHWEIPAPITTRLTTPGFFYKFIFDNLGIKLWLTWAAMVLAIISTASLIPDFVLSGAIELTLSKPIGRVRLFITKYLTGLLFAGLQVALFTTACFLVIGIRGGEWEPRVFLAIPIVLSVFSFLYCVSALAGMLTRSTIASVLITGLFWFVLFLLNAGDAATLTQKTRTQLTLDQANVRYERREKVVKAMVVKQRAEEAEAKGEPPPAEPTAEELAASDAILARQKVIVDNSRTDLKSITWWNTLFVYIKTPLPKTADTTGLLERNLLSMEDIRRIRELTGEAAEPEEEEFDEKGDVKVDRPQRRLQHARIEDRVEELLRSRSLWWVLGTSFAFEAAVLAAACLVFARKDF